MKQKLSINSPAPVGWAPKALFACGCWLPEKLNTGAAAPVAEAPAAKGLGLLELPNTLDAPKGVATPVDAWFVA